MDPSIWELETFYRNRDLIIIGAGFTGLWTAISVKEKFPAKSVLVVERSSVPIGASTRNAGFACFGSLTEIIADSQKMGGERTLELVKMRFEGLKKIQDYFTPDEIDFELCGGYEILNNDQFLAHIDDVNFQLKSITGLQKTFILNSKKLEEFGFRNSEYLVENPCEGNLHSGKLLQKLLEKCHGLGVEFLFGTEVSKISEDEDHVLIKTENFEISAENLIIATNAFTKNLVEDLDLFPARGQILLTEPIENLKIKGTFHYDEGFYYFRNLGNRILLGGARNLDFETEETSTLETTDFLQNHLENFLKTVVLPGQKFKVSHRWSGIMAMGAEKSPVVKAISKRQIVAVRLSGMGVALAPKIGEQVAEMIGDHCKNLIS
ncbi:FAD-binding oxidoreductase [Chryseobacterium sp. HSC-36S06]|uniref:NAD(P)/FAD-dependent oxidoreductase n=1 Tax=Chryseobacterium sp. HSC-36S06 TaxID=2910970 RepID=UPI0020A0DD43|nr:FAD-binding oxidoreductase [Chryseobacterium sp. HSC-36S06]MCP2038785.1 glycine/D-amino acid oxidase-like deaminating enzyme [Chryseobacterium sp. HSC-36S06]